MNRTLNSTLSRFAVVAALAVTAQAVASAPLAAQQDLGRNGTSWRWDGPVSSGQSFRLYNVNGPVNVTASSDGSVHVRAEKRVRNGGDASTVHYAVVRSANGVTVCALWTDGATCDENGAHGNSIQSDGDNRRQNVEVSFDVQVPNGVRSGLNSVNGNVKAVGLSGQLSARTVNGSVDAERIGSPVSAKTVNGDITVSASGGPLDASTVNGSVHASLGEQGTSEMTFKSVNGTIDITAPSRFNADVSLSTVNGSIDSKYSLNYDRRHRHADGVVGSGGAHVSATTVNGSIHLR
ncbi:MAG: DUF4097 family beta strand repeat-containing protein [Gemmatimonadaceae bacterium]